MFHEKVPNRAGERLEVAVFISFVEDKFRKNYNSFQVCMPHISMSNIWALNLRPRDPNKVIKRNIASVADVI